MLFPCKTVLVDEVIHMCVFQLGCVLLINACLRLELEGERNASRMEEHRLGAEASHHAAIGPAKIALADAEGDFRKVSFLEEEEAELLGQIAELEALKVSDAAQWLEASLEADRSTVQVLEATRAGGMVEARERRRIIIKGAAEWMEATTAAAVEEGARLSSELRARGKSVDAVLQRCSDSATEEARLRQELDLCDGAGAAMARRVKHAKRRISELSAALAARSELTESSADVRLPPTAPEQSTANEGYWHAETLRRAREKLEAGAVQLLRVQAARADIDTAIQEAARLLSACVADCKRAAAEHDQGTSSAMAFSPSLWGLAPMRDWSVEEAVPANLDELSDRGQVALGRDVLGRLHAYRQSLRLSSSDATTPQGPFHSSDAQGSHYTSSDSTRASSEFSVRLPPVLAPPQSTSYPSRSLNAQPLRSSASHSSSSAVGSRERIGTGRSTPSSGVAPLISKTTRGAMQEAGLLEATSGGNSHNRRAKNVDEEPFQRLEYSLTPAKEKWHRKQGRRPSLSSGSAASRTITAAPSSVTTHHESASSFEVDSPLSSQVF